MDTRYQHCSPELWGGAECTVNRINDQFRDQLAYAGHYQREGDIDRFASLGITALRYPVLWELHEPEERTIIDWSHTAIQLERIRSKKIIPIAGLLHHGSGPAFTNLTDPQFSEKLAAYAQQVAERFPWLEYYTPVNEPLTTARFSGLYGFWYPHHSNDRSFAVMLINQLKGIVRSMQAIRNINPAAKLIQTEDLAETHSTPLLRYQKVFENRRRWITYDLLCGKVSNSHFFWKYFSELGIPASDLEFFLDNPCPPYIMGFNYYVTSERYLDENLQLYPSHTHGGNGKHSYADTEAVRSCGATGIKKILKNAWRRYRLPMALTEVHLACTHDEQLRWFKENWDNCVALKKAGIDIRAVTAWALLGAFDWCTLLTKNEMCYESGVFDIRNDHVRETPVAKMLRKLAAGEAYDHPYFSQPGWWHRQDKKQKTLREEVVETMPDVSSSGNLSAY